MAYDTARQEHIQWLQQQVEDKKAALNEAEVLVSQLKADIKYFELMISVHQEANTDALDRHTSVNSNLNMISSRIDLVSKSNKDLVVSDDFEDRAGVASRRFPKEMLRPEFIDKTLAEVSEIVLNSCNETLSADDIARVVFLTKNGDEYIRARNSLSTELRRGAKEGRWKQIKRGFFASKQLVEDLRGKDVVHEPLSVNGNQKTSTIDLSFS